MICSDEAEGNSRREAGTKNPSTLGKLFSYLIICKSITSRPFPSCRVDTRDLESLEKCMVSHEKTRGETTTKISHFRT